MTLNVNHGAPWSAADFAELEAMMGRQANLEDMSSQLGRTKAAIEAKVRQISIQRNGPRSVGKHQQRRKTGASFFLS